ncbi:MAG TPA: hypothetical protein VKU40_19025, partial [Thermoanaerobaculia bacterium]|nr:hypothetical protein [Thermoanaerobaculia bacterium]
DRLDAALKRSLGADAWSVEPRGGSSVGRVLAWVALAIALLAGGLVFLIRSRLAWVRRLRRHLPLLASVCAFPAAVVVVTLLTYLAEHRLNEHFSNPAESFWSITVYLFSGLEDRVPYTTWGKAAAAMGLILGPLLFTVVTGWVASRFIRWERKMPKNLTDHFLLINWNERGLQAVRQIHHPVITANQGTAVIVVLSDDHDLQRHLETEGMGQDELFEDLYVTLGDPTRERALLNANAQDAHTILLLADERQDKNADERTVRTLFVLRKIALDHGRRDLHVVVELIDPANQTICDQMAPDFPGLLESVASGDIRSCLLAQATLNHGVVQFYKDLLTVSADSNELYSLPIPPQAVGMRFVDYAGLVLASSGDGPVIPVGIQRDDDGCRRLTCNPRPGCAESVLAAGDQLVVLAYEPPRADELPVPSAAG